MTTTTGAAAAAASERDDPSRLSTAPLADAPVSGKGAAGPGGLGPVRVGLRQAWRQLTSMRTALLLLFLLALVSVPGGFLPQRPTSPVRVNEYLAEHTVLGPLLDRLQMFDVFASSWFAAIYLLLFISLVGCLGPRIRLHARALRVPPPRLPARLDRLPVSTSWQTTGDLQDVQQDLRRALRRGRWRTVVRNGGISAEKGYLRETGNLVFHVSLVLLLVGIALASFLGFKGTVLVKEGEGFANAVFSYDDVTPGRRFDPARLVPFAFTLEDFRATYNDAGQALTFNADVRWTGRPGGPEAFKSVEVNQPLTVGQARVYLIGHGYAPRIVVRDPSGAVAFDQTVPCLPQDPQFVSLCTVKVPDAVGADGQPVQYGLDGLFTPTTVQDPQTGQVTSAHPAPENPALTFLAYSGDLGIDAGTPKSVYELDTDRLTPLDPQAQALRPGETWQMPGGGSVTLAGVDEWATFQVTQDPGKWVALAASIGIVAGLMLSLFVRRRRVWVRLTPTPGGTTVEVGGLPRSDTERFTSEFDELTERLRATVA